MEAVWDRVAPIRVPVDHLDGAVVALIQAEAVHRAGTAVVLHLHLIVEVEAVVHPTSKYKII